VLGLLPHQIMRACAMGLRELAYGTRMLVSCWGCYQCQRMCPQRVRIGDVLVELKIEALKKLKEKLTTLQPQKGSDNFLKEGRL